MKIDLFNHHGALLDKQWENYRHQDFSGAFALLVANLLSQEVQLEGLEPHSLVEMAEEVEGNGEFLYQLSMEASHGSQEESAGAWLGGELEILQEFTIEHGLPKVMEDKGSSRQEGIGETGERDGLLLSLGRGKEKTPLDGQLFQFPETPADTGEEKEVISLFKEGKADPGKTWLAPKGERIPNPDGSGPQGSNRDIPTQTKALDHPSLVDSPSLKEPLPFPAEVVPEQVPKGLKLDAPDFAEELVARMNLVRQQGETQLQIQIKPEILGQLRVEMQFRDGKLKARFIAANPQVREMLAAQLPLLRESLAQQGTQPESLTVDINEFGSSFGYEGGPQDDGAFQEEVISAIQEESRGSHFPTGEGPGEIGEGEVEGINFLV